MAPPKATKKGNEKAGEEETKSEPSELTTAGATRAAYSKAQLQNRDLLRELVSSKVEKLMRLPTNALVAKALDLSPKCLTFVSQKDFDELTKDGVSPPRPVALGWENFLSAEDDEAKTTVLTNYATVVAATKIMELKGTDEQIAAFEKKMDAFDNVTMLMCVEDLDELRDVTYQLCVDCHFEAAEKLRALKGGDGMDMTKVTPVGDTKIVMQHKPDMGKIPGGMSALQLRQQLNGMRACAQHDMTHSAIKAGIALYSDQATDWSEHLTLLEQEDDWDPSDEATHVKRFLDKAIRALAGPAEATEANNKACECECKHDESPAVYMARKQREMNEAASLCQTTELLPILDERLKSQEGRLKMIVSGLKPALYKKVIDDIRLVNKMNVSMEGYVLGGFSDFDTMRQTVLAIAANNAWVPREGDNKAQRRAQARTANGGSGGGRGGSGGRGGGGGRGGRGDGAVDATAPRTHCWQIDRSFNNDQMRGYELPPWVDGAPSRTCCRYYHGLPCHFGTRCKYEHDQRKATVAGADAALAGVSDTASVAGSEGSQVTALSELSQVMMAGQERMQNSMQAFMLQSQQASAEANAALFKSVMVSGRRRTHASDEDSD